MQTTVLRQPKIRSKTVTFRIDPGIESALEQDSRRLGTNLNGLVAQIFRRYITWGRYADQLKLFPVSKELLRELFASVDKKTVVEIGTRLAQSLGRDHILFLFQQVSLNTVIRYLDIWRSHFDSSQHTLEGKTHFYTLHHDVNLNFSVFIKEYISTMIQSTIPRPVRFETISPSSLTFSFEEA